MAFNLNTHLEFNNGVSCEQPVGLFIDNKFIRSIDGETLETINPATKEIITRFYVAGKADVEIAVKSAHNATREWATLSGHERGVYMNKLCDLLEDNVETIASIEAHDSGKPYYTQAKNEVGAAIQTLRYYAGWADKLTGDTFPCGNIKVAFTKREPLGVYGLIVPWNFPLLIAFWKIAPALAAGNCVVVKQSEITPLSLLYVCKFVKEAGFPKGVINVVSGPATTGKYLAENQHVDKVSFTGSTSTAKKVLQSSLTNLKETSLECGGKSPMIVLSDANIEAAADAAHATCMSNMGQICSATSRVYVHESVYEKFLKCYKELVEKTVVGDPFEEATTQGPQISETQMNSIKKYIVMGVKQGVKVLQTTVLKKYNTNGYYVEPVIFYDVSDSNIFMREEIFGPVVAIDKFNNVETAIKRCNDSIYGLTSSVFTNNLKLAHDIASNLESGQVFINCANDLDVGIPFGGVKQSGDGRELGIESILAYTSTKSVHIKLI